MNYRIKKKNDRSKKRYKIKDLKGYSLAGESHKFMIEGTEILNIIVLDSKLIQVLVSKKVRVRYDQLIRYLTNLLTVVEDDTGTCCQEALNMIEKFRLEIKNKYRNYLSEKELKEMANQLKVMRKVALEKEMEIKNFLAEEYMGKSR